MKRGGPLVLLSACVFFVICTEMLPVGLLPEIGRGLGVSEAATGVLVSLYAVLVALTSVPIAAMATRWPRREVLGVLLGAYALSNVVFAVTPNYPVAMIARTLGGLAHAGFFAVAVAAAVSMVDPRRSGRAIAVVMVGNALALVAGIPLGTLVGTALGWRWTFAALAVIFVGLTLAVLRVLPPQTASEAAGRPSVWRGIRQPAVIVMAAVITVAALGHFTLYTYISPLFLADGVARTDVGVALIAYGGGGLLGLGLASLVVGRHPRAALLVDLVVMGISLVLAASAGSSADVVVVAVLWGASFGAFPTLTQTVTLQGAGESSDAASAVVNATTNIGIAGGAFLGSRLLGTVPVPALGWVGAGLVAAALVGYAVWLRAGPAGRGAVAAVR